MTSAPKNINILITGASSGIGAATARLLASHGHNLLLLARREDRLQSLQQELGGPGRVKIAVCDVSDREAVARFGETHKAFLEKLDVLVNNAGLALGLETLPEGQIDDWETMIDTNVKGLLYFSRLVLPYFLKRKAGHVVNIGSIAGHQVYPAGGVYCATKFAVRALNEAMRIDTLGSGVRVTSVDPGKLETEFSLVRFKGDAKKAHAAYQGMRPLQPEDIAETIAWCLDRPAHVNIQEVVVMPTDQASVRDIHITDSKS